MIKSCCGTDKEVVDYSTASPVGMLWLSGRVFPAVQDCFDNLSEVSSRVDLFSTALFPAPDAGNIVVVFGFRAFQAFQRMKERCKVSFLQRNVIVFLVDDGKITIIGKLMY